MVKKLHIKKFIERAIAKHGLQYDYSRSVYVNGGTKLIIICPIHGNFFQTPFNHMAGAGCPVCGKIKRSDKKRLTIKDFVTRSKCKHKEKYDYSKVVYKGSHEKVIIICPVHGKFLQLPHSHLSGLGCKKCDVDSRKLSLSNFILKAQIIHGNKYDYKKVAYKTSTQKICIICPNHGEFWQTPNDHLGGSNCPFCGHESTARNLTLTQLEFINKSQNIHGEKYGYSNVCYVNNRTKVCITCKIHGNFYQKPNYHLLGQGCPRCNSSKGEKAVAKWLEDHQLEFNSQHTFPELKGPGEKLLVFDFFVPYKNTLIEYDGIQHTRPVRFNGISCSESIDNFKKTQHNDGLKSRFCLNKGLILLRICHKEINNIPEILSNKFSEVK